MKAMPIAVLATHPSMAAMRRATARPEFQRLWTRGLAAIASPKCCVCGKCAPGERTTLGFVCVSCIQVEAQRA